MQQLFKRKAPLFQQSQKLFALHKFSSSSYATKEKLFDKILIANRGEIACRIINTCRKLGIKTVAVYSEADANAKHVRWADEAICIGKAPVKESYLRPEAIIEAMKVTGAQAVHPGFGFLSENSQFAQEVKNNGFVFIGPPPSAIDALGEKLNSKALAKEAGVSTIPGFEGEVVDANHAKQLAEQIGYPVMIKAASGGGGKGMRIAWNEREIEENFILCRSEAENFFGSKTMLIEKYIEAPRHVEIQVLCDQHGTRLYLPERECSIQRRNQKVIEEAPSSVIDDKTRNAMGRQAVALCAKVGYYSAGTVEMLVDPKNNFYFLEMNTRLQVEHPITEAITGLDLVEQMIRVAAGHPLQIKQEDIKINGWATECRVYAEDPTKNFSPSIGTLTSYKEPHSVQFTQGAVRCDSGILQGSEISVYYDPMISKTIAWGKDRNESISRMVDALDTYIVAGVKHNIPLLRAVLEHKDYVSGKFSTYFLKDHYSNFKGIELNEQQKTHLAASAAIMEFLISKRDMETTGKLETHAAPTEQDFVVEINKEKFPVTISEENDVFIVDLHLQKEIDIIASTNWRVGDVIFRAKLNNTNNVTMQLLHKSGNNLSIVYMGTEFNINVHTPLEEKLQKYMPVIQPPDLSKTVIAPMPGSLVRVNVKEGDTVSEHQELLVIEAMKMQNSIRAVRDGVVKKVNVKAGDIVSNNQKLIEFV